MISPGSIASWLVLAETQLPSALMLVEIEVGSMQITSLKKLRFVFRIL